MDFRFTPEQEDFRREFTAWLARNLPDGWDAGRYYFHLPPEELNSLHRDLQKRLQAAGYAGMHYPKEYGGQGRNLAEEIIVLETLAANCLELRLPGLISFGMAGPTLLFCGSEEQKRDFLPRLLDGTHVWCQGFSEPNAGSDVVNVSTRAVKEGDHYLINGQKTWTSYAHMADYCLLLARTDLRAAKHKGLSYFLLDMKTPGVEVRPIRQITGGADFNEVFLQDVKVPERLRVEPEGQGWRVALTTLMFERAVGDAILAQEFLRLNRVMIEMARTTRRSGRPIIEDPVFRQDLARLHVEALVLKYHGYRGLSQLLSGGVPGPEGSIGKLLWSEHQVRAGEAAMRMLGQYGQLLDGSPWTVQSGTWPFVFLLAKGSVIAGGTSEIQRNIIAERVLGLPKESVRSARQ
ncbi:MAG: acyl-CoA dehydrogenase family protein [Thermodesulfobacteriota bacterium]